MSITTTTKFKRAAAKLLTAATIAGATVTASSGGVSAAGELAAFTPLPETCRLLDSRLDGSRWSGDRRIDVGGAGRCGIPADATAVAATVTVVNPSGGGHMIAWPAGGARPATSMLNYQAQDIRAAGQVLPLGAGGDLMLHTVATTDVVVDVAGYWQPVSGPVAAGRFQPVNPVRLLDTRLTEYGGFPMLPGETKYVSSTAYGSAMVLNVTWTMSSGRGHMQLMDSADSTEASVLNVTGPNQTRAAMVVVPANGSQLKVVTQHAGGHVIVDLIGVITNRAAPQSTAGLLDVWDAPRRLLDTRTDGGVVPRDGRRTLSGFSGHPVGSVALLPSGSRGFAAIVPSGTSVSTSNVNGEAHEAAVGNGFVAVTSSGRIDVFAGASAAHVVVDAVGEFTPGDPTGVVYARPWVTEPELLVSSDWSADQLMARSRVAGQWAVLSAQGWVASTTMWDSAGGAQTMPRGRSIRIQPSGNSIRDDYRATHEWGHAAGRQARVEALPWGQIIPEYHWEECLGDSVAYVAGADRSYIDGSISWHTRIGQKMSWSCVKDSRVIDVATALLTGRDGSYVRWDGPLLVWR